MSSYLSKELLKIKDLDSLRFKEMKRGNTLDSWSNSAFNDIQMDQKERSSTGSFYTPEWIVVLMVKNALDKWLEINTKDLWNAKILEPSCGSGNYVEVIVQVLLERMKVIYPERTENEIISQIATNMVFAWDLNPEAIIATKSRIEAIFGISLKNCDCVNTLFQKGEFDLIVGNPPYGNLLSKEHKKGLNDKYGNIALSFLDWGFNSLSQFGVLYYIVPHSFSRTGGGASLWRTLVKKEKSIFEVLDVGNPFFDITLEQIIVGMSKDENIFIQTNSIRENKKGNLIYFDDFYTLADNRMLLYRDKVYDFLHSKAHIYPFNGKRGKDFSKGELDLTQNASNKWYILGKNVDKSGLKHIAKYDRYIPVSMIETVYTEKLVVITQFGTNLKAAVMDAQNAYPSGGVVIISHQGLTQKQACEYLNTPFINLYLNRYVLNNAELTVHLDGKYLAEIPLLSKTEIEDLVALCTKED